MLSCIIAPVWGVGPVAAFFVASDGRAFCLLAAFPLPVRGALICLLQMRFEGKMRCRTISPIRVDGRVTSASRILRGNVLFL